MVEMENIFPVPTHQIIIKKKLTNKKKVAYKPIFTFQSKLTVQLKLEHQFHHE